MDRFMLTQAKHIIERVQRGAKRECALSSTTLVELDKAKSALEDAFHQLTWSINELTSELLFSAPDLPTK